MASAHAPSPEVAAAGPAPEPGRAPGNAQIAARLAEAAALLEEQQADRFRVAAYARAARTVAALDREAATILRDEGLAGLVALEGVGDSIARAIAEMVETGRWAQLERLRGASAPEALFRSLPGIGPVLAARIHEHLHADTLEALEAAAQDGRLAGVPGVGPRLVAALRDLLAMRLGRVRGRRALPAADAPPVALLLEVDALYRARAAEDALPRIAPRRFNPGGEAWLPVLHLDRGGWSFTALFSNTARAHELGRTRDWVVIYFARDGADEGQCTVVTERRGPMEGRRVVRGREAECARLLAPAEGGTGKGRST